MKKGIARYAFNEDNDRYQYPFSSAYYFKTLFEKKQICCHKNVIRVRLLVRRYPLFQAVPEICNNQGTNAAGCLIEVI